MENRWWKSSSGCVAGEDVRSHLVVAGHDRDRTPDDLEDGELARGAPRRLKSIQLPTMSFAPCSTFPLPLFPPRSLRMTALGGFLK